MWILGINHFGATAVSKVVKRDLDNFYIRVVNPCDARCVKVNVRCLYGWHYVLPLANSTVTYHNILGLTIF